MNLAHECLEKTAARIGARTAMIACDTGETLTYLQINSRVNSIAVFRTSAVATPSG